jgi:hypothetical protein
VAVLEDDDTPALVFLFEHPAVPVKGLGTLRMDHFDGLRNGSAGAPRALSRAGQGLGATPASAPGGADRKESRHLVRDTVPQGCENP